MKIDKIEKCGKCGKKTKDHEWIDSIPLKEELLGMKMKRAKRFKCSKCKNEMFIGSFPL